MTLQQIMEHLITLVHEKKPKNEVLRWLTLALDEWHDMPEVRKRYREYQVKEEDEMLMMNWPTYEEWGRVVHADRNNVELRRYAPMMREQEDEKGWPKVCWFYVRPTTVCLGRRGHDKGKHESLPPMRAPLMTREQVESLMEESVEHKALTDILGVSTRSGNVGWTQGERLEAIARIARAAGGEHPHGY